jgi:hypothetical protein
LQHIDGFPTLRRCSPSPRPKPPPSTLRSIRAASGRRGRVAPAFRGVTDNDEAREYVRTIAAWRPLPESSGHAREISRLRAR